LDISMWTKAMFFIFRIKPIRSKFYIG